MQNRLTVNQIKQIAEKYIAKYDIVAIRTQEVPYTVGELNHKSSIWIDGEETSEKLNGVSATNINAYDINSLKMHSCENTPYSGFYFGDYQAIICGNDYTIGEDAGEVIIHDPIVVEIIR